MGLFKKKKRSIPKAEDNTGPDTESVINTVKSLGVNEEIAEKLEDVLDERDASLEEEEIPADEEAEAGATYVDSRSDEERVLDEEVLESATLTTTEDLDPEIERLISDPTVIGYSTRDEQMAVYSAVIPMGYIPQTDTILDVGCGVGDLYAYLQEIRLIPEPKYKGIDYNANMINLAKIKFPEIENDFSATDLFDVAARPGHEPFDWVIACSAFNIKMHDDMIGYSLKAIDEMLALSSKGIGINFISQDIEESDPEGDFIKYNPADIFKAIVEKYPDFYVIIQNNYIEGDFSIHIYKKGS